MKLHPWEPDLRTIVDRIDAGDIDLQPNFQRQEIWALGKKKRLIDTILRGWSIPPIFLVVVHEGKMDVLDGQQRLAAIRDFVHSEFPIDGKITPADTRIQSLHGKTYRRLSPADRRLVDTHTLRCFKITDYSPDEPSELFYRLNQPSMLTAGEQRNAFYGPAREQLKELVNLFEAGGNDKSTIGFSNVRLAYDDIIARLLFFLEAKSFSVKGTEARISARFKERDSFSNEVWLRASRSIESFSKSRANCVGLRLNKASALSWMLFFARFDGPPVDLKFLSYFHGAAAAAGATHFIPQAAALFADRASLRVTDVSSVAYRDFALWYIFHFARKANVPPSVPRQTLERVAKQLRSDDEATFESVLSRHLEIEEWSKLP